MLKQPRVVSYHCSGDEAAAEAALPFASSFVKSVEARADSGALTQFSDEMELPNARILVDLIGNLVRVQIFGKGSEEVEEVAAISPLTIPGLFSGTARLWGEAFKPTAECQNAYSSTPSPIAGLRPNLATSVTYSGIARQYVQVMSGFSTDSAYGVTLNKPFFCDYELPIPDAFSDWSEGLDAVFKSNTKSLWKHIDNQTLVRIPVHEWVEESHVKPEHKARAYTFSALKEIFGGVPDPVMHIDLNDLNAKRLLVAAGMIVENFSLPVYTYSDVPWTGGVENNINGLEYRYAYAYDGVRRVISDWRQHLWGSSGNERYAHYGSWLNICPEHRIHITDKELPTRVNRELAELMRFFALRGFSIAFRHAMFHILSREYHPDIVNVVEKNKDYGEVGLTNAVCGLLGSTHVVTATYEETLWQHWELYTTGTTIPASSGSALFGDAFNFISQPTSGFFSDQPDMRPYAWGYRGYSVVYHSLTPFRDIEQTGVTTDGKNAYFCHMRHDDGLVTPPFGKGFFPYVPFGMAKHAYATYDEECLASGVWLDDTVWRGTGTYDQLGEFHLYAKGTRLLTLPYYRNVVSGVSTVTGVGSIAGIVSVVPASSRVTLYATDSEQIFKCTDSRFNEYGPTLVDQRASLNPAFIGVV